MMKQKLDAERIGNRLRELRGIKTRRGVAKETGISYSALSKYEIGLRVPRGPARKKLAEYYGVSEGDLFLP